MAKREILIPVTNFNGVVQTLRSVEDIIEPTVDEGGLPLEEVLDDGVDFKDIEPTDAHGHPSYSGRRTLRDTGYWVHGYSGMHVTDAEHDRRAIY